MSFDAWETMKGAEPYRLISNTIKFVTIQIGNAVDACLATALVAAFMEDR